MMGGPITGQQLIEAIGILAVIVIMLSCALTIGAAAVIRASGLPVSEDEGEQ